LAAAFANQVAVVGEVGTEIDGLKGQTSAPLQGLTSSNPI